MGEGGSGVKTAKYYVSHLWEHTIFPHGKLSRKGKSGDKLYISREN